MSCSGGSSNGRACGLTVRVVVGSIPTRSVCAQRKREKIMANLTLEEAAAYSGIGINKLRKLSDDENCPFVLWIGSKRLIKRRKLDEYTEKAYSL